MTDIEHLDRLLHGFKNLDFQDNAQRDKLERSTEMVLKSIFGEETKYAKDFSEISFFPLVFNRLPTRESEIQAWESGKIKATNLLSVAKEQIEKFGSKNEGKKKGSLPVPSTITVPWLFNNASIKFWLWAATYSLALVGIGIGIAKVPPLQPLLKICTAQNQVVQPALIDTQKTAEVLKETQLKLQAATEESASLRESISRLERERTPPKNKASSSQGQSIHKSPGSIQAGRDVNIGAQREIEPALLDSLIKVREAGDRGYNILRKLDDDKIEEIKSWIQNWEAKAEALCRAVSIKTLNKIQSARNKQSPFVFNARGNEYAYWLHRLRFQIEALNEIIGN